MADFISHPPAVPFMLRQVPDTPFSFRVLFVFHCVCVCRSQKRASDPLKLALQTLVRHYVSAITEPCPLQVRQMLLTICISLGPYCSLCNTISVKGSLYL